MSDSEEFTISDFAKDARNIFLSDIFYKLHSNLNRIKQLQLFTIDKFYTDYIGNQWFLYKPKYESFAATDDSLNVYNSYNTTNTDDIDIETIKTGTKNEDLTNVPGEIWIRLFNTPCAYPIAFNVCALTFSVYNLEAISGDIYSICVQDNFGYIYYGTESTSSTSTKKVFFFTIEQNYTDTAETVSVSNYEDIMPESFIPENTSEIKFIKRQITMSPLCSYVVSSDIQIIDCLSYSGNYYLFYFKLDEIQTDKTIYYKCITAEESKTFNSPLDGSETGTVILPTYSVNATDVCTPADSLNFKISVSSNNINIAYDSLSSS